MISPAPLYAGCAPGIRVVIITVRTVFAKGFIMRQKRIGLLSAALLILPACLLATWPQAGAGQEPPCALCDLVDSVDPDTMESLVRHLSGEEPVYSGGEAVYLYTRYAFTPEKHVAAEYLASVAHGYGYSPVIQQFVLAVIRPDLTGIALSGTGDTVWAGTPEGEIYMAGAYGGWNVFEKIENIECRVYDMLFGPGDRLFAAGREMSTGFARLMYSDDGGESWGVLIEGSNSGMYAFKTISFWQGQFGFIAGDYGSVMNTGDGGMTWWSAAPPSDFSYRSIHGSDATGPVHFWAVTEGGYVYESLDMGNSWEGTQLSTTRLWDIDFFDGLNGVIVGIDEVFHTSDGGETWNEAAVAGELRCVKMTGSSEVVAGGADGELWTSGDGGATWSSTGTECAIGDAIWRIALRGLDEVWAAGGSEIVRADLSVPGAPVCGEYSVSDTIMGKNIVFRREGFAQPDHRVVICGHYDSQNRATDPYNCAPGADDNGTGTACVLECARLLSDALLEKTVEFILFDGEEVGLKGSSFFTANLDAEAVYEAAINIDMVGNDYGGTSTIYLGGQDGTVDTPLVSMMLEANTLFGLQNPLEWHYPESSPTSDHIAFRSTSAGRIPSVLLLESGHGDNPHYHNCSDLVDYVDFDYVSDSAKAALGTAARLAGFTSSETPVRAALHRSYPNPFFSSTRIEFELPQVMDVKMTVYDAAGRRVATLIDDGAVGPGKLYYLWDGTNDAGRRIASGIYFLRFRAGNTDSVRKIIFLQ